MKNMPPFPADPSEGENMKDDGLLQPTYPATSWIWTSAYAPLLTHKCVCQEYPELKPKLKTLSVTFSLYSPSPPPLKKCPCFPLKCEHICMGRRKQVYQQLSEDSSSPPPSLCQSINSSSEDNPGLKSIVVPKLLLCTVDVTITPLLHLWKKRVHSLDHPLQRKTPNFMLLHSARNP